MSRPPVIALLTLAGALATAAPAAAAITVEKSGDTVTVTGAGANDTLTYSHPGANFHIVETSTDSFAPSSSCAVAGNTADCSDAGVARLVIKGGDGQDTIAPSSDVGVPVEIDGGAGDDKLTGADKADIVTGGADDDLLSGGGGGDRLVGNGGTDTVSYQGSPSPVTVTIGAGANDDGTAGEGDDVSPDTENVIGGNGDDSITGNPLANVIFGGPGGDSITAGGGADLVLGEAGADRIVVVDGRQDRVLCGDDADFVNYDDGVDALGDDCEMDGRGKQTDGFDDFDHDGVTKAAGDCNDTLVDVYPGAPDFFGNGIDEDCDGQDAVNRDVDGDGYIVPVDCNDRNRNIKPTAQEIYGNDVDENCNGLKEKLLRLPLGLSLSVKFVGARSQVARMTVRGMPELTRITVRCRGKGCKFKSFSFQIAEDNLAYELKPRFKLARLAKGAVIEVKAEREGGYIARIKRFTMRPRKTPQSVERCVLPGETKERKKC